jgi:hypothetical protein
MRIVEREFVQEIDVAAAVVIWNYFDHEHLTVVHRGYTDAQVLYEKGDTTLLLVTLRVPLFRFLKSHSLSTMVVQERTDTKMRFFDFNMGLFGIPSINRFDIEEIAPDRTRIVTRYKFILRSWRMLLAPLLYRMMERWNRQVWLEDLPLKLRRHKVLRHGFQDFVGMPEKLEERKREGELRTSLPVARPRESELHQLLVDDDPPEEP